MAGQAVIKGVVFFVYEACKASLESADLGTTGLLLAAMASGAVGSLVVTPVERQGEDAGERRGHVRVAARVVQSLLETDGVDGFLLRGLGATPRGAGGAFYFVSHEYEGDAARRRLAARAARATIGGAVAGAAAWVPVYLIDVVKTNIQVADGGSDDLARTPSFAPPSTCTTTASPPSSTGWAKLARAVVNHAVTFCVRPDLRDADVRTVSGRRGAGRGMHGTQAHMR